MITRNLDGRAATLVLTLLASIAPGGRADADTVTLAPISEASEVTTNLNAPFPTFSLVPGLLQSSYDGRAGYQDDAALDFDLSGLPREFGVLTSAVLNLTVVGAGGGALSPSSQIVGYGDPNGTVDLSDFHQATVYGTIFHVETGGYNGGTYILLSIDVYGIVSTLLLQGAPYAQLRIIAAEQSSLLIFADASLTIGGPGVAPVPEPSGLGLMGLGLASLVGAWGIRAVGPGSRARR